MSRAKVFTNILMVLILIALSGASVWAAPNGQDLISGVVEDIEIVTEVDPDTGETTTTVLVTLIVETTGETQTVRVSVDTAKEMGLLQVDDNGDLVLDDDGNPIPILIDPDAPPTVDIDSDDVIGDGEEVLHPVALALAEVFDGLLGLEKGEIMGYHEDGFGFGVIAQACWMAYMLNDPDDPNATGITPRDILDAKKNHTLGSIDPQLLGVEETPTNWGQFKKAVLKSGKVQKNLANLGAIMSGRVKPPDETDGDLGASSNLGQGKGKKGKGPGEDGPPGKSKKGSEGGGPPAEPPGKVKNKDKGKGGGKDKGGGKGKGK
jgi:hypothetical protein